MLATTHETTYYYNREDQKFNFEGRESLKSYLDNGCSCQTQTNTVCSLDTALVPMSSVTCP